MRIGVHLGLGEGYEEALDHARALGCTTVQIFTHSPRMFAFKPLDEKRQRVLRDGWERIGIGPVVSHASYLINIASAEARTRNGGLGVLQKELDYAAAFGCQYVVLHVGKFTGSTKEEGMRRVAEGIATLRFPIGVMLLLETAAGQGTEIGRSFAELQQQIALVPAAARIHIGVCLDTCHIFAAGYDITTKDGVARTIKEFDETVGLARLKVIHVNDSKMGLGEGKDRHEHLGTGKIGLAGLRMFLTRPELKGLPMILETPIDDAGDQATDMAALRKILS